MDKVKDREDIKWHDVLCPICGEIISWDDTPVGPCNDCIREEYKALQARYDALREEKERMKGAIESYLNIHAHWNNCRIAIGYSCTCRRDILAEAIKEGE